MAEYTKTHGIRGGEFASLIRSGLEFDNRGSGLNLVRVQGNNDQVSVTATQGTTTRELILGFGGQTSLRERDEARRVEVTTTILPGGGATQTVQKYLALQGLIGTPQAVPVADQNAARARIQRIAAAVVPLARTKDL